MSPGLNILIPGWNANTRKGIWDMSKQVRFVMHALIICLLFAAPPPPAGADQSPSIYVAEINDTITSGTAAFIARVVNSAERDQVRAIVIILDTPGGIVSPTLDIVKLINDSPVPVITYVAPIGAVSASAGTFILLSGHIAAMAPGTTCGAAMPVQISGQGRHDEADEKTIKFMAEHIESIAELRNRPVNIAGSFVNENLSLSNRDALTQRVIDIEAATLQDLLARSNGKTVRTKSGDYLLNTADAGLQYIEMNVKERFIHNINNPMLAMLLIIVGLYGLIFALHSPGFFLPEIIGSISFILGLYGIGLFAVNISAGLLILLGLALLIAEAHTPTSGILGVGGIASLVLGILLFPVEPLLPFAWWSSFRLMAIGTGVIGAGLLVIILRGIWGLRRFAPVHGESEFASRHAVVVKDLNPVGLVQVQGEIWQARTSNEAPLPKGSRVRILKKQGLGLLVERINGEK